MTNNEEQVRNINVAMEENTTADGFKCTSDHGTRIYASDSPQRNPDSNSPGVKNVSADDSDHSPVTDLTKFRLSPQLIQRCSTKEWTEVDSVLRQFGDYRIGYYDVFSSSLSIVMRAVSVYINVRLAIEYWMHGEHQNFAWTTACIVTPMCITTLIHANMCHQDGKFNEGTCKALKTLWLVFLSSFLFRYWNSLRYSIKCKQAERAGAVEAQMKYYKLMIREESDVAFIRIFECFLEAAPQKILQISIVLRHVDKITTLQIIAICSYFGSTAWCLTAYHRCSRFAQIDKHNISTSGLVLQICWHFCISVSRTVCISLVACMFPLWTLLACLSHALFFGFTTFIVDRPQFARTSFLNYLFCLVLGLVYLFTYISVKDGSTKMKYSLYYLLCFFENILCIILFRLYASSELVALAFLLYPLFAVTIIFYCIGIAFMISYYMFFHPNITSRISKHIDETVK